MKPIKTLLNRFKASFQDDVRNQTLFGWHPTGINTLDHYRDNQYENGYGSITKIVNAFMDTMPYTVDAKAEKVDSRLKNVLYHPNQDMSSSDFREALAVMSLIHDRVFILVWREENGVAVPGGEITPDNIAGFTFLENPVVTVTEGKKLYTYNGKAYTEDEVIELKDINPYNLHKGYSAARAAEKWATIDDYIAAYQKGFFRNGAVPAGQFIITASTVDDFNDEVDKLEAKHKGAGKNNNIVYVHRPTDRDGKATNAKIEWVPFNVQNKDLALNDIFEQANKKIDSVYGVPAEIRGILSNSNYASVNVAEKIFIKYVVKPFTQKIWTRFTHQLNRITGGLDVAISFELEVPGLVDEEKVEEETKKIRDDRVQLYLLRGYTIESIKRYLDTDDLTALEKATIEEEDNADVDEGDEVEGAPNAPDGSGDGTMLNEVATRKNPKAVVKNESPNPEVDAELVPFEVQIEDLLKAQIDRQASRLSDSISDAVQDATEEENNNLTDAIAAILLSVMLLRGVESYDEAMQIALSEGLDISETSDFVPEMTEADRIQLREYIEGFNEDTSNELESAVAAALIAGVSVVAIKSMLQNFSGTQGYRLNRFAQNEAWTAAERAKLQAIQQLTDDLNKTQLVVGFKTWVIQPGACPLCTPHDGEKVEINQAFSNGLMVPPLHVNCRCTFDESFEVITAQASVERNLHCSSCDRFLGVTDKETYTDKIKCANSKCKALDVPLVKESVQV